MIDKPKHPKYDFIHEIEELATMKMPIIHVESYNQDLDQISKDDHT
jgi:hypothetical protein